MEEHDELAPDDYFIDRSYPFLNPPIDNYCNEKITPNNLTREDIRELGFLRTNPQKNLYFHATKARVYLEDKAVYDFSIKDTIGREVEVYYYDTDTVMSKHYIYKSNKPSKEEIRLILDKI